MTHPEDTVEALRERMNALHATGGSAGAVDAAGAREPVAGADGVPSADSVRRASGADSADSVDSGDSGDSGAEAGSIGGGVADEAADVVQPEESRSEWKKAKEMCFDLLAARPRTTDELRSALRRKGFDEHLRDALLRKLDEAGLVDDTAFARMWVRSRHTQRGLAKRALIAELERKGVDGAVAAEAAGEIDRDAEAERARELVRKRLRGMTGVDEQTAVRRLLGMLGRKGYSQGLSYEVIKDELRDAGADTTPLGDMSTD